MSDDLVIRMAGGWGAATERMSPAVRARVLEADHDYDRQTRDQEAERRQRAVYAEQAAVRMSVEQAVERGETVDPRRVWEQGGVGRTRQEALAYYSAQADLQDAVEAARIRRLARELGLTTDDTVSELSADVSAPLPADAEADQELLERGLERRKLRREISKVAGAVVRYEQRAREGWR